jgi:hypothetical protein
MEKSFLKELKSQASCILDEICDLDTECEDVYDLSNNDLNLKDKLTIAIDALEDICAILSKHSK